MNAHSLALCLSSILHRSQPPWASLLAGASACSASRWDFTRRRQRRAQPSRIDAHTHLGRYRWKALPQEQRDGIKNFIVKQVRLFACFVCLCASIHAAATALPVSAPFLQPPCPSTHTNTRAHTSLHCAAHAVNAAHCHELYHAFLLVRPTAAAASGGASVRLCGT